MKQSYFDETYILTYDLADENTKDTAGLNVIDTQTDVNYILTCDLADENTKDTVCLNVIDTQTDVNYIFYY